MSVSRRRGFTLIEVLVAMTIVLVLTALLAMGLGGSKDKAAHKASKALVSKIKVALESYNAEFRDYPPDGYDQDDPGWNVANDGVAVKPPDNPGPPAITYKARRVKGTAALVYFLCRPQIKQTLMSSDPGDTSMSSKRLEPFLQLDTRDYTRPKITITGSGEEITFDPNHPWNNDGFWDRDAGGGVLTEIIDAYGRPLCYDKVRTALTVSNPGAGEIAFYNPDLFQTGTTGSTTVGVEGLGAHPDAAEYIIGGLMPINADQEPSGFADADEMTLLTSRMDPRYHKNMVAAAAANLEGGASSVSAAAPIDNPTNPTTGTHEAKNVPGYNLWSAGRSWIDFRDDIVSWAD